MNHQQPSNHLQLIATIETLNAERYTPAGVLATDLVLMHQSQQIEVEGARQVNLTLKAVAFDELAYQLRSANMQTYYMFNGFLASRGRTQQVILHVTKFWPVTTVPSAIDAS